MCDHNANDVEVQQVSLRALKKIKKGDTLIWGRLGRSGKSKNPSKQHYNQKIAKSATNRGVNMNIKFLPPLGKYFDPLELLFNDLKQHHLWVKGPRQTRRQLMALIGNYMEIDAQKNLPGFFWERANGREAKREGLVD